jgi:hypothetical protein
VEARSLLVAAEDRDLTRLDSRLEPPLLLTRAQAAQLFQVSEEILDQWSYEPGFLVIRRNGGHFVRIHRAALERWLEQFALGTSPRSPYGDAPPSVAAPRGNDLERALMVLVYPFGEGDFEQGRS